MKVTYFPVCIADPNHKYKPIPADDWIHQTINKSPGTITRRELYLGAANADGGAHVDRKQKKNFSKFAFEGGFGFSTRKTSQGNYEMGPLEGLHLLLLMSCQS
jgi:hypothetical protein